MEKDKVSLRRETITIPTYKIGKPEKNPFFLEKRVYQGSSGKVYPFPVTEKIFDEKVAKKYQAITLENRYLKIIILPELGGRVYRALDKTNQYDFVYYNHVIKPQLVGLAGAWISGGIEFNWPQHHRPDTFLPIESYLKENEDGSKTVWISDIDRMYGTKSLVAMTLYPDKAYLEIKKQFSNPTSIPQTFLWWANPAVPVNDYTQSIFPPDVHAVFDHGKRAVSNFPIATGEYYKMDYSAGVDISRYKNVPVPTSFMAAHSDYDFLGNYDHKQHAGLLHIADHHTSPGKKQWTWGNGDFGRSWDYQLTDNDGPYIELMAGTFTDNQPDFSWLKPYEEKTATEYFLPYKNIGAVKNATINAAVNIEQQDDQVRVRVYATTVFKAARIVVTAKQLVLLDTITTLTPEQTFDQSVPATDVANGDLQITVTDANAVELVHYQQETEKIEKIPEPAKAIPEPQELQTNDELYLAGLHLEQYRHATYQPGDYYLEGLRRDPTDYRLNDAYGLLLFRQGQFTTSESYFRKAVKKQTLKNPNPYSGAAYYHIGLSLFRQEKQKEAFDAFYKATWSFETQSASFYWLAAISSRRGDVEQALTFIDRCLVTNWHNLKARVLKANLLRRSGKMQVAKQLLIENLAIDVADLGNYFELYQLEQTTENKQRLEQALNSKFNNLLVLAGDYLDYGCYQDADAILSLSTVQNPMQAYYKAYAAAKMNNQPAAQAYAKIGSQAPPDYVFPNKLLDIVVLQKIQHLNPQDGLASYYLGNLWYDKRVYKQAIQCWEHCTKMLPDFPTAYRNLAIAYYNKQHDAKKALRSLEKAYQLNEQDGRVMYELATLYEKLNRPLQVRFDFLHAHLELAKSRDDSYLEYITLLNELGHYQKAYELIMAHKFHPWEGGEGKVSNQYVFALIELAKQDISAGQYLDAIEKLTVSLEYPRNLGEGKLIISQDNITNFYLGLAYRGLQDEDKAVSYFKQAEVGLSKPTDMMYYNDQPADTIFYQGLALEQLGKPDKAKAKYYQLIEFGKQHLFNQFKMDYFAVSLPDTLLFDEDYQVKNTVHCYYLIALGYLGLGESEKAQVMFNKTVTQTNHHQGILRHQHFVKSVIVIY